ncbi:ESPR-type extended signal peptide-containing protein [Burkholderia anthina]|uniref:ESPR-type extended signal peptide-containing protein n=1 Tax=Burkholderia anthina TaxID=179879 RepID=UPI000752B802|nr:ESPR-type extended signal peptide-containing protein [Burkholderia anthina]KVE08137.1 hypothetical protein WS65_09955 [Burkholderia anthina]
MNKAYRNIWNTATGTWTAVAETARSRSKGAARTARRAVAALALGSASIGGAFAADACRTEDGKGLLDAAGVCNVTASRMIGANAIGTTATLTDDYFKVNGTGTVANAATTNSIAIGVGAAANAATVVGAANSIAIGSNAVANGSNSISIGTSARHSGSGATVVGANAAAMGGGSGVAIGNSSSAAGSGSVAMGPNATATGGGSTAIGSRSSTTNNNSVAIGNGSAGSAINTTAIGSNAKATGDNATGLGQSASASGLGAIGIGFRANARADRSVAIGMDSVANRDNTVSVGSATLQRQIVNVAAGTQAMDAVNVSQLQPVVTALGGGATINSTTGAVTGPTYTLTNGGTQTTVGGALDALDGALTTANGNIARNTGDIADLASQIGSGTVGLVQQAGAGANITVGANTDGAAVDFTGTAGARKLTGVDAGAVTATSKDAVNGSQLNGVSSSVASAIGGGSTVNADGSISAPSFSLGDGSGGTTTVHSVGDAVTNLDGRVTTNEGAVASLADQIGNGKVGLVQQAGPGANITVGANTDGAAVSFVGTAGARKLSGVANGVNDDDVVTIAQLRATGLIDYTGKEVAAVTYDDISLGSVTFGGTGGTKLLNVAPGLIAAGSMEAVNGGQLHDLQERFAQEYARLDGRVGNLESGGGSGGGGGGGGGSDGNVGRGTGGDGSLVVGNGSVASGENSSAVGQGSNASGSNSSAIGQGAVASGDSSTAVGQGSKATGNGSVAIGAGSVADRDNSVSVGSAGHERQITNVAAGTAPTDAVNVRQMNNAVSSARKDAMGGVAAAMAVAGLPQSTLPGRTFVAMAGSTYGGEVGSALGVSYMTRDGKWTIKAGATTSSRGEFGGVVGGGFYW